MSAGGTARPRERWWWRARRTLLGLVGIPRGIGLLVSTSFRRSLLVAVAGSVALALLDAAAVVSVLPLMQLMSGGEATGRVGDVSSALFGHPPTPLLVAYLGATMTALFLIKGVATIWYRWWLSGVMSREQLATASALFSFYLRAPFSLYLRRGSADLLTTMGDAVSRTYGSIVMGSLTLASDGLSIVALMAAMAVLLPVPTLLLMVYFAVVATVFQRLTRPRILRHSEANLKAFTAAYQAGNEGLGALKEIQITGAIGHVERRYRSARAEWVRTSRIVNFLGEFPRLVLEVSFVGAVALMAGLALATPNPADAVAMLAVFAAAGFRILPNLVRILGTLTAIRGGAPAVERVLRDLRLMSELPLLDKGSGVPLPFERELRVENVTYRYGPNREPAVSGVSLTLPFGSSIALVGHSGAGKSTIVDIVLGLLTPEQGRVAVDGVDIADHRADWHAAIGVVPQSISLLTGSLRDNIAFGQDVVDEERLAKAVWVAHLEGLVASRPEGLDAPVGERGARLSGGERQRVGVARALYRDPRLLIFDEATSSLDNETEHAISESVSSLSGRVTLLVVAHRLSTVRHCEQVALLDAGSVVDVGTFEELRARNAAFARMVELGRLD